MSLLPSKLDCCQLFPHTLTQCLDRHIEEERVAEAFDRLDSDDSGFISRQNLRDFLGKEGTTDQINRIMNEGDKDNDGKSKYYFIFGDLQKLYIISSKKSLYSKVSYQEFLELFRKETQTLLKGINRYDSTLSIEDEPGLVGIDLKIPGGKFDS